MLLVVSLVFPNLPFDFMSKFSEDDSFRFSSAFPTSGIRVRACQGRPQPLPSALSRIKNAIAGDTWQIRSCHLHWEGSGSSRFISRHHGSLFAHRAAVIPSLDSPSPKFYPTAPSSLGDLRALSRGQLSCRQHAECREH